MKKKQEIEFLTLAEIIEIHNNQILLYGGEPGVRDFSLLSSAIAIPRSTFEGNYLYNDIFEMAAAYIYHICQNHPFIDGYKRVALVAGLIFLDLNNISIEDPNGELYRMMINVDSGKINKDKIKSILKQLAVK